MGRHCRRYNVGGNGDSLPRSHANKARAKFKQTVCLVCTEGIVAPEAIAPMVQNAFEYAGYKPRRMRKSETTYRGLACKASQYPILPSFVCPCRGDDPYPRIHFLVRSVRVDVLEEGSRLVTYLHLTIELHKDSEPHLMSKAKNVFYELRRIASFIKGKIEEFNRLRRKEQQLLPA